MTATVTPEQQSIARAHEREASPGTDGYERAYALSDAESDAWRAGDTNIVDALRAVTESTRAFHLSIKSSGKHRVALLYTEPSREAPLRAHCIVSLDDARP